MGNGKRLALVLGAVALLVVGRLATSVLSEDTDREQTVLADDGGQLPADGGQLPTDPPWVGEDGKIDLKAMPSIQVIAGPDGRPIPNCAGEFVSVPGPNAALPPEAQAKVDSGALTRIEAVDEIALYRDGPLWEAIAKDTEAVEAGKLPAQVTGTAEGRPIENFNNVDDCARGHVEEAKAHLERIRSEEG